MNDRERRFKLAEAMGWKTGRTDTVVVMGKPIPHTRWIDPDGNDRAQCPDPENNANDCEALIRWLETAYLIWITIRFGCNQQASINMNNDECEHYWSGDNWKQGVCELALKLLDTDEDRI